MISDNQLLSPPAGLPTPVTKINMAAVPLGTLIFWMADGQRNPDKAGESFIEIDRRYRPRLYGLAINEKRWHEHGPDYDIDAFVSATLQKAYNHAPKFDFPKCDQKGIETIFWAWLCRTIENVFCDCHRKRLRNLHVKTAVRKMLEQAEEDDQAEEEQTSKPNKNKGKKPGPVLKKKYERLLAVFSRSDQLIEQGQWWICASEFRSSLNETDQEILGFGLSYYDKYSGLWRADPEHLKRLCEHLKMTKKAFLARRSKLKQKWFDYISKMKISDSDKVAEFNLNRWPKLYSGEINHCYNEWANQIPLYFSTQGVQDED